MVAKGANASEVVNGKGHEVDVLCNKICKDIGASAIEFKLLPFVLVVLERMSNRCG